MWFLNLQSLKAVARCFHSILVKQNFRIHTFRFQIYEMWFFSLFELCLLGSSVFMFSFFLLSQWDTQGSMSTMTIFRKFWSLEGVPSLSALITPFLRNLVFQIHKLIKCMSVSWSVQFIWLHMGSCGGERNQIFCQKGTKYKLRSKDQCGSLRNQKSWRSSSNLVGLKAVGGVLLFRGCA